MAKEKEKKKAKGLKITKKAKKNLKEFQKGFNSPGGILRKSAQMLLLACCIWYCCSGTALAQVVDGSLKMSWEPVTKNQDGSQCKNLAGYKVYVGESAGNYTRTETLGTETITEVDSLEVGKDYFIAITAFNTYNQESIKSKEITAPGKFYKIPAGVQVITIIEVKINVTATTSP